LRGLDLNQRPSGY